MPRWPSLGISREAFCLPCPRALVKTFLIMINYTRIKISPFTEYTNNRGLSLNTTLFIHLSAVCCGTRFLLSTCRLLARSLVRKLARPNNVFHISFFIFFLFSAPSRKTYLFLGGVCPSSGLLRVLEVFPLRVHFVMDAVYGAAMTSVKGRAPVKDVSLARLARRLNMRCDCK